jgi:cell wall-associated NlpC family hydrolase
MRAYLITLLLGFGLIYAACSPYPRYSNSPAILPQEVEPTNRGLTTSVVVKFGLILQSYLGKPYAGTSKWEEGLDCSRFTAEVYKRFNGTDLPRQAAEQYTMGREVPHNRIQFGDLVFFRTEGNRISHVGVAVGYGEFIHASTSQGVIISRLSDEYWARRFVGARRVYE